MHRDIALFSWSFIAIQILKVVYLLTLENNTNPTLKMFVAKRFFKVKGDLLECNSCLFGFGHWQETRLICPADFSDRFKRADYNVSLRRYMHSMSLVACRMVQN